MVVVVVVGGEGGGGRGRTLDRMVLGIKAGEWGGTAAAQPRKAGTSERPLIPSELQLNYRKQAGK